MPTLNPKELLKLPIKYFRPDKELPGFFTKDAEGNAGWDLIATETTVIKPGEVLKVPVNLQIALPTGYYGTVTPRSGLSSEGINVIPGTIDSNYRGQIRAIVQNINQGDERETFIIKKGMRIAQLIVQKHEIPQWEEVDSEDELGETERGTQGFNSSGLF